MFSISCSPHAVTIEPFIIRISGNKLGQTRLCNLWSKREMIQPFLTICVSFTFIEPLKGNNKNSIKNF